ncbi:MAG TPA: ATPase, T2SS/T4P/T4SS family, partial [Kofleriaceae bacterium]|nr:ATPase, T2SS/T4P/T4SS family [Kofleriaceae bacterium]
MESEGRPRRVAIAPEAVVDFLAQTALFQGCERKTIEMIAPHVFPVEVPAGLLIVRAGTPEPGIGLLSTGRAAVRRTDAATGAQVVVEEVAAGDAFGVTGAFLGTTQPHDVIALEDSVVFLLGHEVFLQLATKVPAFAFAAARELAAKAVVAASATTATRASAASPPGEVIPFVRISAYDPTAQVIAAVPAKLIQQHRLLPLELRDQMLTVGMVDPTNTASRAELQRVLATASVAIVAISQDDFHEAYVRLRIDPARAGRGTRPLAEAVAPEQLVFDHADQERDGKAGGPIGDEVVALANRVIAHAIERGASDVHVDHNVNGPRIRFRVQGQLYGWDHAIPAGLGKGLVARLKVLAGLDVTERRLPQDGRLGVR